MKNKEYICFDTETTGFSFVKGDKVVEVGAVKIIDGVIVDTFQKYIDPQRNIPDRVIQVHGITNEKVNGMPLFHEIAEEFLDFCGDAIYVAHNARFDISFIGGEIYDAANKGKVDQSLFDRFLDVMVIDTLAYSRATFKKGKHNLNALSERLEIDHSHRDFHGALLDADLLAQVFLSLDGGNQMSLIETGDIFNIVSSRDYLGSLKLKKASPSDFKPRQLPELTKEEKEAHMLMMKRIKKESDGGPVGGDFVWDALQQGNASDKESINKSSVDNNKDDKALINSGHAVQSPNFRL